MNTEIEAGTQNLLQQCAKIKNGEKLLLVGEQGENLFFDPQLCHVVAESARKLGIDTEIVFAEPGKDASHFPVSVSAAMEKADVTIFFSRLGDQVRFISSAGQGRKIMTYTETVEHLGSMFSIADFTMMKQTHDNLLSDIKSSMTYTISADNGTSLSAILPQESDPDKSATNEFSVELFPVMIFPPLNFYDLNGKLVIEHFVLSSSTRAYEDSELRLDSAVTLYIRDCQIFEFDGDSYLIDKLRRQLKRAAAMTGGDPYRLNSWHTGINSYTFYHDDPYSNLEKWGTVAYGSPRYTHFHASGKEPGDICFQLMDASISFDKRIFWDRGKFTYLDQPAIQSLFESASHPPPNSSTRLSIGL